MAPPRGPIYALNEIEQEELLKWLQKNDRDGTRAPFRDLLLFPNAFRTKGPQQGPTPLRGPSKITIPNWYPLPNMGELRERVR